MDERTKVRLHAAAASAESGFDRFLIRLAGNRFTLGFFVAWTVFWVVLGWWVG